MKNIIKTKFLDIGHLVKNLVKWGIISLVVGVIGGLVGTAFVFIVEETDRMFSVDGPWIFFLPIGGIVIVYLYRLGNFKEIKGTNRILEKVRHTEEVPIIVAPLIFIGTAITHLFGGSAGREGAAIQLGGAIGGFTGKIFDLDEKDMSIVVLCGVTTVFAALFGTPLTATIFALEVVSVGIFYHAALVPCLLASLIALKVSEAFGIERDAFQLSHIPPLGLESVWQVAIVGGCCALVSVIFILSIDTVKKYSKKWIPNPYFRIVIGGIIIVALTLVFPGGNYNGSGEGVIFHALEGQADWWTFLVKILFTAITLGVGFKGGEIIPIFFVGATMGAVLGGMIGLDPGFCAGIAMVAAFCGAVNCPIASIILGIELFGAQGAVYFAIACSISYMMSGYYSLYGSQKIVYSKTKAEFINIHAK